MKQTDIVLQEWLTGAIAIGGPYDPAATWVGLASAIDDKGPATAMADVTEAPGGLATRVKVTAWSAPTKLPDGRWCVDGPLCKFTPASAADAGIPSHYFYASALVAGNLKAWHPILPGINLIDNTTALSMVPRLTIDPAGNFEASVVFAG